MFILNTQQTGFLYYIYTFVYYKYTRGGSNVDKLQDGGRNLENCEFFRGHKGVVLSIQWIQNLSKIAFSYGFRDKQHFLFPPKVKMAAEIRKF